MNKRFKPTTIQWRLLALVAVILGILLLSNPAQKGGVSILTHFLIAAVQFLFAYFWLLSISGLHPLEHLGIAALVSAASYFISVLYVLFPFVEFRHEDRTWELWETADRITANMILFGASALVCLTLINVYRAIRLMIFKQN